MIIDALIFLGVSLVAAFVFALFVVKTKMFPILIKFDMGTRIKYTNI